MRRAFLASIVSAVGVIVLIAPVTSGASVGAKGPNPCKLLKPSEIERVLGQPTAAPKKGLTLPSAKVCNFAVSAGNGQPEGEASTFVQTVGAHVAYDVNSKLPSSERVAGIPKSYYDANTGALNSVKGDVLVSVQLVFISIDGGPGVVDRKAEATELMKIARKRV